MITRTFLLTVLALATLSAPPAWAQSQVGAAVDPAAEDLASCTPQEQPMDAAAGTGRFASCPRVVPDCRPVHVTLHEDPFWLEPDVEPTCPNEWANAAWERVWGLLLTPSGTGGPVGTVGVPVEPPASCPEQVGAGGAGQAEGCASMLCLPVFLELDLPSVQPVLRPECIQQIVQDVRELIGA